MVRAGDLFQQIAGSLVLSGQAWMGVRRPTKRLLHSASKAPEVRLFLSARECGTTVSMAKQSLVPKKKRGPIPSGKGVQIQVRLHEPLLSDIDRWVATHEPNLSRPEAIRRLVQAALKAGPLVRAAMELVKR